MLSICCIVIILAAAVAMLFEGLFAAVVMLVNVVLAGIFTYSLWEPATDYLETLVAGTFLAGMEDFLCMALLFAVFLVFLRFVTRRLTLAEVKFNSSVNRSGALLVGLLTGYLVAGFLVCAMETLPLGDRFLGFEPRSPTEEPLRRYFPPDRVWSAMMRHVGANTLDWNTEPESKDFYDRTFDPHGTFERRYLRYRRYSEKNGKKVEPLLWQNEIGK